MTVDGRGAFDGRVAVVTGAGSGIGRATAAAFAAAGATVSCVDLDGAAARRTVALVEATGSNALAVESDATSPSAVSEAVSEITERLGPISVLFNCAGGATLGSVHELSDEAWNRCLTVNLTATFYWCRGVLPGMLEHGGGVIVNMASSLAVGAPRFAAYSAAKAGVRGLTMQMARDYGPTVRVNSVSPAAIDTPGLRHAITSSPDPTAVEADIVAANKIMKRLGTPTEVASAVVFAASDEASFMTGQDLVLCGGQTVGAY